MDEAEIREVIAQGLVQLEIAQPTAKDWLVKGKPDAGLVNKVLGSLFV